MRRRVFITAAFVVGFLPLACTKGPAEAALKAADQALEQARPEVERFAAEEWKALAESAKAAHESFGKGDYKAALAAAQEMPAKVQGALEAAKRKKAELIGAWNDLKATLPGLVDSFKARIEALTAQKKLPKGFEASQLENARSELTKAIETWTAASSTFEQGDIASALATASELKARVEAALGGLPEPTPKK